MNFLPDFFFQSALGTPVWLWAVFLTIVIAILVFDLGVLNRKDEVPSYKQSLCLSLFYISLALLFGGWVWLRMGHTAGLDFYTGYLIEYSLSIDNIFVISVIFAYFKVPREFQHRVLFWGILGVVLMRGLMIGLGTALIHEFEWIMLLFGAFLVFTGIKMLLSHGTDASDIQHSPLVHFLEKHIRVTKNFDGHKFFVRAPDNRTGKMALFATPLFLALVTVEFADLIFAVDSIPAVFAITTNTFVVYTSNIFAVLGLRALYFLLAAMVVQFRYLSPAVSLVLILIGCKVFYAEFFGKVDSLLSLSLTFGILAGGLILSVVTAPKEQLKKELDAIDDSRL